MVSYRFIVVAVVEWVRSRWWVGGTSGRRFSIVGL